MEQSIQWSLTLQQAQYVHNVLTQRPMAEVEQFVMNLRQVINAAQQPPQPEVPEAV